MRISGKKVADQIKSELKLQIQELSSSGITPTVAIITLGPEGAWESYVRQKIKIAEELGIKTGHISLANPIEDELITKIKEIDNDPAFHGIIVQRPLTEGIDRNLVIEAISPVKDIDGFRSDSPYGVPLWLAAKRLIEESILAVQSNQEIGVADREGLPTARNEMSTGGRERPERTPETKTINFKQLSNLKFVVLGKGETAGGPVIRGLQKMGIEPAIIDSKTQNPDEILKKADVIIPCVGKPGTIKPGQFKEGAILIGVGTHTEDDKLRGDYVDEEIEPKAGAFTPTPGGVGPVNLSYLYKNLIDATLKQI